MGRPARNVENLNVGPVEKFNGAHAPRPSPKAGISPVFFGLGAPFPAGMGAAKPLGKVSAMTTENKFKFKDAVIVVGMTVFALALLPLVAVLGVVLQFGFVAVFPVLLIGTMGYALFTRAEPVVAMIRGIEVPNDVLFWRGHSWARKLAKTCVVVGVDDFAQRMIGPVDVVETVPAGTHVDAGERVATLHHGERTIQVQAPIDGIVSKPNPVLAREPSAVNTSPYGRGWLVEIQPEQPNFKALAHGRKAMRWMRQEVENLIFLVQGAEPMTALPDGGELTHDVSGSVDDETWKAVKAAFFES